MATAAWGLVAGVAMLKAGLAVGQASGMSLAVFAGSAQLAAAPLMAQDASLAVVLITALIINLRFIIYAAALAPHLRGVSRVQKLALGYLSGDISFVVCMQRVASEPGRPHASAFLYGAAGANWLAWQVSSFAGIFLASFIPASWGLDFAGTLALTALAIPLVRSAPT